MSKKSLHSLAEKYPNIVWMIETGTIEITNEYKRGIVARAYDEGGVIWEEEKFKTFDDAINALEEGIKKWYDKNM
ncbi:MAG: hypothetical protein ABIE14_05240 [Patescibacteria group bacterium]